jgi:AcrR family transcriptional regulator
MTALASKTTIQNNQIETEIETIETGESAPRSNGRPRSEKSMQAILDTTNKMLLMTSVRDVSIESVAKKAGVGKTTIYRWWPNKVALVLDAISGPMNSLPAPVSGGNPKDLLEKQLERFSRICRGRGGKVIAEVYAESQGDAETQALFFQKFMVQHEEILASILEQGKASGDFRANLDTALTVDMIYGAFFYQLMSNPEPLNQNFANSIIMEALRICK